VPREQRAVRSSSSPDWEGKLPSIRIQYGCGTSSAALRNLASEGGDVHGGKMSEERHAGCTEKLFLGKLVFSGQERFVALEEKESKKEPVSLVAMC